MPRTEPGTRESETYARSPLVSVLMPAFNHRAFIDRAVESVLMQTDVDLELIIGDDASHDGTASVVQRYAQFHPGIVRLHLRPQNIGMFANFADIWRRATGKFIAVLEGDDYWSHPGKLASQASAMTANPRWSYSFHRVEKVDAVGRVLGESSRWSEDALDWSGSVRENFAHTCSVMYRAGIVPEVPRWFQYLAMTDWPLNLLHGLRGEAGYLDEMWGVYRQHEGGIWSSRSYGDQALAAGQMLACFAENAELTAEQRRIVLDSASRRFHEAASTLAREGRRGEAQAAFRSSLIDPFATNRLYSRLRTFALIYLRTGRSVGGRAVSN